MYTDASDDTEFLDATAAGLQLGMVSLIKYATQRKAVRALAYVALRA